MLLWTLCFRFAYEEPFFCRVTYVFHIRCYSSPIYMDPFEDFNLSLRFVSYISPLLCCFNAFGFLNLEIRNYNVVSDLCYLLIYIPRDECRFLTELVCVALT